MKIWSELLNLFFPRLCLLCEEPLITGEEHMCTQCLYKLPVTKHHTREKNPVEQLFLGKFPFDQASAFLTYEKGGSVQKLIHSLKYKDNKELGYYLGRLCALELTETCNYKDIDLIVPVPLHQNRLKSRGYNQAEWIARGVKSVLKKPVDTDTICRIKATPTQTRKTVYDRWINVHDIFEIQCKQNFAGKHLLLIDDVITTGSTIGAVATTILTVPKTRISILSIAIA